MSGRSHLVSSEVIAVGRTAYTAVTALARGAQFLTAFVTGYAASYGIQLGNSALIVSLQWLVAVNLIAWLLARQVLAGWWATVLGLSGFFLLGLPRLLVPVCPAGSDTCVVSPFSYLVTLAALLVTATVAALIARRLREGRRREEL